MPREALGEFEHQVLLAILHLGGEAHSAPIVTEIESRSGRSASPAAVYIALRRLEQRDLVRSEKLEPGPNEGGRGRRTFRVTDAAIEKLRESRRALEAFWTGLDPVFSSGATRGTIKLGIQFEHWSRPGESFMHALGSIGKDFPFASFHHFWVRGRLEGRRDSLWDYCLGYQAARRNRFAPIERIDAGGLQGLVYAYHFDASLYAGYLRRFSERLGVERIEGRIETSQLDRDTGFIESVTLADGRISHDSAAP